MNNIPDRQLEPDTTQEERELATEVQFDDAMGEYLDTGYLPDGSDTSQPMQLLMEHEEGRIACDLLRAYRRGDSGRVAGIGMEVGAILDAIVSDLIHKGMKDEN